MRVSTKRVVRRLAAILVADAVGYSSRMQANEMATHQQVSTDLDGLLAPLVRSHRGRVVKTTGDGLLAEFRSIVGCVECAVEMQDAVAARQSALPEEKRLPYRIGINLGDIIVERGDIYGDGVNVATRLQALAEPGGILLSGDAYRQVKGKLSLGFEDLGDQHVKNITEPVRVFRIIPNRKPQESRAAGVAAGRPVPALPALAVLPFDNLSGDAELGYFADGLTNDLITDLAKFAEFSVVASHTEFFFKGKQVKVSDVGRDLGVQYVVEGSVQRVGDRIRINVQLVETEGGGHLWAERYDHPMQGVSKLQDEIVQIVVGTLVTEVSHIEILHAQHKHPDKLGAYDLYLRGRAAWFDWTSEANRRAQEFFAGAIELEPRYARAHGYLAFTLVQAWYSGWSTAPDLIARACDLARRAVALGPSDFENHWSLAGAHLYNREFDEALSAYERALALNPNSAGLLADMGDAFLLLGRVEESIALVERAMRMNPRFPDWYYWTLGSAFYHAGRFEQSLAMLKRIGDPPNLLRRHLAAVYLRLGRLSEARAVVAEFLERDPGYTLLREQVWPYKDPAMRDAFLADLRAAGFPE